MITETIRIAGREWRKDNLDRSVFRNGDEVYEARSTEEWWRAAQEESPAWCWYVDGGVARKGSGRLYNWYAINDPRGLAPRGWRIAGKQDWLLVPDPLELFTPSGMRFEDGSFYALGRAGYWWCADQMDEGHAWFFGVSMDEKDHGLNYHSKGYGFSVRCVKEDG